MRSIVATLMLTASLITLLVGCAKRIEFNTPLMFQRVSNRGDIADFVHLRPNASSLSVEVLGFSKWPSDSVCTVSLQIGTYAYPGFQISKFHVQRDSAVFAMYGVPASAVIARSGYSDNKPYTWVTLHTYIMKLHRDQFLADSVNYLPFTLALSGYVRYDGQAVPIDTVKGYVKLSDDR